MKNSSSIVPALLIAGSMHATLGRAEEARVSYDPSTLYTRQVKEQVINKLRLQKEINTFLEPVGLELIKQGKSSLIGTSVTMGESGTLTLGVPVRGSPIVGMPKLDFYIGGEYRF